MSRYNQYEKNQQLIKDYFSSGTVMFRGVLEVIYLAAIVGINLVVAGMTKELIQMVAKANNMEIAFASSPIYTVVSLIVTAIPFLLIAIAYFIIFGKSNSESPSARPNAGFTILNVFAVIDLVIAILVTIGSVLMIVIFFSELQDKIGKNAIISLVGTIVACALKLIVAIVYKLYIGSVLRTAKSVEMRATGSKAYGVFSVLRAICSVFNVIAWLAIMIFNSKIREILLGLTDNDNYKEIITFVTGRGIWVYVLFFILSLAVFVIYIVDAVIAFGYNNRIKEASMDIGFNDRQSPPSSDGFYGDSQPKRRKRRDGYGDRFIED